MEKKKKILFILKKNIFKKCITLNKVKLLGGGGGCKMSFLSFWGEENTIRVCLQIITSLTCKTGHATH